MKQILTEDNLTQSCGMINLAKAPPLEPPTKTLNLGLTKELGQDMFDKLFLIRDIKQSAVGKPGNHTPAILAGQYRVKFLHKVGLVVMATSCDC